MVKIYSKPLYQELVSFYSSLYGLTPLGAKIYVYLMFDFKGDGVSFDELVKFFNAGKSSVSNTLQMLIHNRFIDFVTEMDSRKRLFRINSEYGVLRFQQILGRVKKEKELLEQFSELRNEKVDDKVANKRMSNYLNALNNHQDLLQETIDSLK